jgi:hypothetical protein
VFTGYLPLQLLPKPVDVDDDSLVGPFTDLLPFVVGQEVEKAAPAFDTGKTGRGANPHSNGRSGQVPDLDMDPYGGLLILVERLEESISGELHEFYHFRGGEDRNGPFLKNTLKGCDDAFEFVLETGRETRLHFRLLLSGSYTTLIDDNQTNPARLFSN